MKFILKPIFEMVTGEYVMFDNIIYNYIIMTVIGLFAFGIAWRCVGKLYDNNIISGKNSGSLIHWTIRLIVFIVLFYIFSLFMWLTKFIYLHRQIICIIICAIAWLTIIITIIYKIRKRRINENIQTKKCQNK